MGHVHSSELTKQPFPADLQTSKGHVDRLFAVALTKHNFPSVDSPQFKQFLALTCDPHVLHGFNMLDINKVSQPVKVPDPEHLYEKHVVDTDDLSINPAESPVPIVLYRHITSGGKASQPPPIASMGGNGGTNVMPGVVPSITFQDIASHLDQYHMVGYLGLRQSKFLPAGNLILYLFLEKSFWNEAKSTSIYQIGCKCYEHFSILNGMKGVSWPQCIQARSADTNLPTLRLMQKIYRDYSFPIEDTIGKVSVDHSHQKVTVTASPVVIGHMCTTLAAAVKSDTYYQPGPNNYRRFKLHTQGSSISGNTIPTPFDPVIDQAKIIWNEHNAKMAAQAGDATTSGSGAQGPHKHGDGALERKDSNDTTAARIPTGGRGGTNKNGAKQQQLQQKIPSFFPPPPTYQDPVMPHAHRQPAAMNQKGDSKQVFLPPKTAVHLLVPLANCGSQNAMSAVSLLWGESNLPLRVADRQVQQGGGKNLLLEVTIPRGISLPMFDPQSVAPMQCQVPSPCFVLVPPGSMLWLPQQQQNISSNKAPVNATSNTTTVVMSAAPPTVASGSGKTSPVQSAQSTPPLKTSAEISPARTAPLLPLVY